MLLIDSGNTALKCRQVLGDITLDRQFPVHHEEGISEFIDYLDQLDDEPVYLASVASEIITQRIIEAIRRHRPQASFSRLLSQPGLGAVVNAYEDYAQLGVDRWLALLAAYDLVDNDAIILDAGSAITIDLLSRQQGHLGGAILPGLQTDEVRFRQLFPWIDFGQADAFNQQQPGRSTLECIHLQHAPALLEDVQELLRRWQGLLQPTQTLLLTGQDADYFSDKLMQSHLIVPDLVFKGMLKQIELQG